MRQLPNPSKFRTRPSRSPRRIRKRRARLQRWWNLKAQDQALLLQLRSRTLQWTSPLHESLKPRPRWSLWQRERTYFPSRQLRSLPPLWKNLRQQSKRLNNSHQHWSKSQLQFPRSLRSNSLNRARTSLPRSLRRTRKRRRDLRLSKPKLLGQARQSQSRSRALPWRSPLLKRLPLSLRLKPLRTPSNSCPTRPLSTFRLPLSRSPPQCRS